MERQSSAAPCRLCRTQQRNVRNKDFCLFLSAQLPCSCTYLLIYRCVCVHFTGLAFSAHGRIPLNCVEPDGVRTFISFSSHLFFIRMRPLGVFKTDRIVHNQLTLRCPSVIYKEIPVLLFRELNMHIFTIAVLQPFAARFITAIQCGVPVQTPQLCSSMSPTDSERMAREWGHVSVPRRHITPPAFDRQPQTPPPDVS